MILLNSKISINILRPSFYVLLLLMIHSISKPLNAQTFPYAPGDVPACMTTDQLKLSTGINWIANAAYNMNDTDRYWQLVSGPNVPQARCATVWAQWHPAGGWVGNNCVNINSNLQDHGSRVISAENSGVESVITTQTTCQGNNTYNFRRRFFVNSTTPIVANLTLNADVDDGIDMIRIVNSTTNNTIILPNSNVPCYPSNTSGPCDGWSVSWNWNNLILEPGINSLEILVENRKVSILSPSTTSTMALNVDATISSITAANVFVKNEYYIPNTEPGTGCYTLNSALYPPYPTYTQTCVTLPTYTGQITITNFNGVDFNYTVLPQPQPALNVNNGTFGANAGTVYTVTASNALGCSLSNTVTLVASALLNVSLSTNSICLPPPPNSSVVVPITITGGTAPFTYSVSPNLLPPVTNNNLDVNLAGTYTLTATDVNNCVSTTFIQAGNTFDLTLNIPTPCVGKILSAQVTPALPNITYSLNGGTPQAGNTFVINTAGIYTVTATDPWGCTSISTIEVFDNPQLQVVSDGVPCYPTFTVLNNSGAALVQSWWISPFNLSVSLVSVPPLLPTQFSPDPQFPIPPPFNYTVTAVDVNGCSATATQYYEANPFCCNITSMNSPNSYLFSTSPAYNNATTNDLLNAFGNPTGNFITTSDYIVIDNSNFVIDQDITFLNCPNLLFTNNTQLRLAPNTTLTIEGSTLQANCDFMWKGIAAYNPDCQVIIKNSTLKDMEEGVFMKAGAKLDCQGSTFLRNLISLQFIQTPLSYNSNSGSCFVRNNYFGSDGLNLYFPHANLLKGECGIHINECREVEIGELFSNNQVQFTNKFENLFCGILIGSGSKMNSETYNLYNNEFWNIQSNPASVQWKLNNYVSTPHGAGIYVKPIYTSLISSNHILNVKGQGDFMAFVDCDKAIAGSMVSANIEYQIANNCLMGFMFAEDNEQKYVIHHNTIGPSMVGMQFVGDVGGGQIYNNSIGTLWQAANPNIYPFGFNISYSSNSNAALFKFVENHVQLTSDAGAGFNLLNTGSGTELLKNTVFIGAFNPANVTGPNIVSAGISANNCKGTAFRGNHLNGTMALLGQTPNALDGMELIKSPSCILECNHFSYTQKGLRVEGDCWTGPLEVKGNTFFAHGRGMWFDDLGTQGSLGNIGNLNNDNNNTFSNSTLFGNGYGIWRSGSTPFSGVIRTNQFGSTFSGPNPTLVNYQILPNLLPCSTYICQPPLAMMAIQNNLNQGMPIEEAIAIAYDSVEYVNFDEVAHWMQEQELVEQLEIDPDLMQANIALQIFYASQMLTNTKELRMMENILLQLNDSTISNDSLQYSTLLHYADSINRIITPTIQVESNMQLINRYLIKSLAGGMDSLSQVEKDSLEILAGECPYIGGSAVYKARNLYNAIVPMAWNDKYICNSVGVNKSSTSSEEEGVIDHLLLNILNQENIKVYPNPSSTNVTIDYSLLSSETGEIVFYDLLGIEHLRTQLSNYNNRTSFSIASLPKGIYIYKYLVNGQKRYANKIVKE